MKKHKKPQNKGSRFTLVNENEELIHTFDPAVKGIYSLSRLIISVFVQERGFNPDIEGKHAFLISILTAKTNKKFKADEGIKLLSAAIMSSFLIRKAPKNTPLNSREKCHLEYCILKEFEFVYTHKRQAPAVIPTTKPTTI